MKIDIDKMANYFLRVIAVAAFGWCTIISARLLYVSGYEAMFPANMMFICGTVTAFGLSLISLDK